MEARRLLAAKVVENRITSETELAEMSAMLAKQDSGDLVGGLIDSFTSIREQISKVMDSAGNLPVIGDQIMTGIQPLLDGLSTAETLLGDRIGGVSEGGEDSLLVSLIQTGIFDVFGSSGLGILKELDGLSPVNQDDVVVSGEDGVQFDFHLGQEIFTDLEFSIGSDMEDLLPLFDFKLDASDGIRFQLSWDLYFGFGFNESAGFYINTDVTNDAGESVPELSAAIDIFSAPPKDAAGKDLPSSGPGINADVSLGLLSAHIEDGTSKRISLTGTDPIPGGIIVPQDFSNDLILEIAYDNGEGSAGTTDVQINYKSFGNESFVSFLANLNATIDEAVHDKMLQDPDAAVLLGELFPISVRPQIMLSFADIQSQASENPNALDIPVALQLNARTPLIKAMTLKQRPGSSNSNLTKWGFQDSGSQSDDDRAIGLGFKSGSESALVGTAHVLEAPYSSPSGDTPMADTSFFLEHGEGNERKTAEIKIRKSKVDGDQDYAEFIQGVIRATLKDAGVSDAEANAFKVVRSPDDKLGSGPNKNNSQYLEFQAAKKIKVTFDVLDKTGGQIIAALNVNDPGTKADDGKLSILGELGSGGIAKIFAPSLQAKAEVRMAVDASMDAITNAIAQAIGTSDTALELPSLSFDLKVDASVMVDSSTKKKSDIKPEIDVKFDNVALDIGPVLDTVVKPIANFVGETLGPIADVLGDGVDAARGFINEPIPVISDIIEGGVTIVDLAPNGKQINDTLGIIASVLGLGNSITAFLENYDGQPINFGCFVLDKRAKFPIPCEVTDTFDDLGLGGGEEQEAQPQELILLPNADDTTPSWTATGLKPDTVYTVSTTWTPVAGGTAQAKYTITNAAGKPGGAVEVTVDQTKQPSGETVKGDTWDELAVITTKSDANGMIGVVLQGPAGATLATGKMRFTEAPPANTESEPDTDNEADRTNPQAREEPNVANSSKNKKKSSAASFLEKFNELGSSTPLSLDILSLDSVLNMLTGEPFDIISLNVPEIALPLGLDFDFSLGPIQAGFNVGAEITAELGFGYDSTGIQQIVDAFSNGAEPDFSDLLDGFFIRNQVGEELRVDLRAGGGGSIGPIGGPWPVDPLLDARARIDVAGGVGLDLMDPNEDGRLRFDELLHVTDNFRSPENLLCIFDIGIDASFDLNASVTILGITLSTDDLPFPTSFDFSINASDIFGALGFDCDGRIAPILAEEIVQDGETVLQINAGSFAANRLFGGPLLPEAAPGVLEADRMISDINGVKVIVTGDPTTGITVDMPNLRTRAANRLIRINGNRLTKDPTIAS